jgi:hypothetical protein
MQKWIKMMHQHIRGHVFRRNLPRGDEGNSKRVTPYVFNLRNVLLYNWRGIIGLLVFRNAEQQANGYAML